METADLLASRPPSNNIVALPNLMSGQLADLLAAAAGPAQDHELRGEHAIRTAYLVSASSWSDQRRRFRRTPAVLAVSTLATMMVATTGLAAASELPGSAGRAVQGILGTVGVTSAAPAPARATPAASSDILSSGNVATGSSGGGAQRTAGFATTASSCASGSGSSTGTAAAGVVTASCTRVASHHGTHGSALSGASRSDPSGVAPAGAPTARTKSSGGQRVDTKAAGTGRGGGQGAATTPTTPTTPTTIPGGGTSRGGNQGFGGGTGSTCRTGSGSAGATVGGPPVTDPATAPTAPTAPTTASDPTSTTVPSTGTATSGGADSTTPGCAAGGGKRSKGAGGGGAVTIATIPASGIPVDPGTSVAVIP